jgi:hypothetical protein
MCTKCLSENFKERQTQTDLGGELEGLDLKLGLYSQLLQDSDQWWTFGKMR